MSKFEDLHLPLGFLTDRSIKRALESGYLIDRGTWQADLIRHASYTLRLGDHVEVCEAREAHAPITRDFVVRNLVSGEHIELKPGDTAKLFSIEVLRRPSSVLAFTVARGLMFFESLVPENTYVDPGFSGTLYTTVTNFSSRIIRLHFGDPVARLFFYLLSEEVEEPYLRGAAKGLRQRLESFPAIKFLTEGECRLATRKDLAKEIRHLPLAGNQIAEIGDRQFRWIYFVGIFALLWPLFLVIANTNSWLHQRLGSSLSSAAALLLAAVLSRLVDLVLKRALKA